MQSTKKEKNAHLTLRCIKRSAFNKPQEVRKVVSNFGHHSFKKEVEIGKVVEESKKNEKQFDKH